MPIVDSFAVVGKVVLSVVEARDKIGHIRSSEVKVDQIRSKLIEEVKIKYSLNRSNEAKVALNRSKLIYLVKWVR